MILLYVLGVKHQFMCHNAHLHLLGANWIAPRKAWNMKLEHEGAPDSKGCNQLLQ